MISYCTGTGNVHVHVYMYMLTILITDWVIGHSHKSQKTLEENNQDQDTGAQPAQLPGAGARARSEDEERGTMTKRTKNKNQEITTYNIHEYKSHFTLYYVCRMWHITCYKLQGFTSYDLWLIAIIHHPTSHHPPCTLYSIIYAHPTSSELRATENRAPRTENRAPKNTEHRYAVK